MAGLVRVSSTVFLELLQGARKAERSDLLRFLNSLGKPLDWPSLKSCIKIIKASYRSGLRVGLPDIMVLADCVEENAKLATIDEPLRKLAKLVNVPMIEIDLGQS